MKKTTKIFIAGVTVGIVIKGVCTVLNPFWWKKGKYKILYVDDTCRIRQLEIEERGIDILYKRNKNKSFMSSKLD